MTCTAPRSLACLAVLLSLSLAASTAEAGKVVVLRIAGDPEGELEDGLMSIIEDRHDLVTSGEFERAARKSGIEDLDGPALGKLARKLGADALIEGTVSREDEGFLLVVRIRGKNGKTVKKVSVDLAKPRFSAKAKKRVGTVVLDGIDMVLGIAPENEEGDDDEAGEEPRPKKKSRKEKNRGKRGKAKAERDARALADDEDRPRRRGGDDEDEDEGDEGDDDEGGDDEGEDDDEDRDRVAARDDDDDADEALGIRRDDEDGEGGSRRKTVFPIARVELGPSAKLRTLSFNSRAFDQAPLGYKSSMVPGVRIAGEAYPIGMVMGGPVANLGIGFEYDQTLLMTSRSSDAPEVTLPTVQKHWDVGARYRIPFGKKATAPMAIVGGGIGRRFFIVDRSDLPAGAELDMPDVAYKYYHVGASVRMPIGMRAAVQAGGRGLMFQSAGSITDLDSYGRAKLTGLDASLSAEFKVTPQILASLAGSFTQIGFAFEGDGAESNNRDLDPTTVDVGGASDRYIGIVGTVGYVY